MSEENLDRALVWEGMMREIKRRIGKLWASLLYTEDEKERWRLLSELRKLVRQISANKTASSVHKTHQKANK